MPNKHRTIVLPDNFSAYETYGKVRSLKGGLCWQDAFIDPTPKLPWAMIKELKYFAKTARLSNEHFELIMVLPGAYHMEWTEDETEWTVKEILKLPSDLLVGGSSSEERALLSGNRVEDIVSSTGQVKFPTTQSYLWL